MEKCENCGGEGLIHQGDSIKFTCSVCNGTGKVEDMGVLEEAPVVVEDESFLVDSSEDSSDDSEEK